MSAVQLQRARISDRTQFDVSLNYSKMYIYVGPLYIFLWCSNMTVAIIYVVTRMYFSITDKIGSKSAQ